MVAMMTAMASSTKTQIFAAGAKPAFSANVQALVKMAAAVRTASIAPKVAVYRSVPVLNVQLAAHVTQLTASVQTPARVSSARRVLRWW